MKLIRVTRIDGVREEKELSNIVATAFGMGARFFIRGKGTENDPWFIGAGSSASDLEKPEVAICKNGKFQRLDKRLKKIAQIILKSGFENFQIQSYY